MCRKVTNLYITLLEICRELGITVDHVDFIQNNYDGMSFVLWRRIEILTRLSCTKYGLLVLCHEMGHIFDYEEGKFSKFYSHFINGDLLKDTPQNRKMVKNAEESPEKWAIRFLKGYGIKFPAMTQDDIYWESHYRDYLTA